VLASRDLVTWLLVGIVDRKVVMGGSGLLEVLVSVVVGKLVVACIEEGLAVVVVRWRRIVSACERGQIIGLGREWLV
jgi:hypothetical protein